MTTQFVVITSISDPTKAVRAFSKMENSATIVVGDKKSPDSWSCPNVDYLSLERQDICFSKFSKLIPQNHYSRKNIGYLYAIKSGAQSIYETDDDNIPKPDWFIPGFEIDAEVTARDIGFINVYSFFSDTGAWPRGLPLERILSPEATVSRDSLTTQKVKVGIWQGLADGDPDVDAIYRLTVGKYFSFFDKPPVILSKGTLCPYNSQNTTTTYDLFPTLYLPSFVSFRFTDILRGIVGQIVCWQSGYLLGFHKATVFQERNTHNLMKDFVDEIPMYLQVERAAEAVAESTNPNSNAAENLLEAYKTLSREGIVPDKELLLVDCWLEELTALQSSGQ